MQKVVGSSPISRLESPPNWQLSRPRGAPHPHDAESRGFECPQRLEILQIGSISHGTLSRSNAEGPEFERATAGPEMPCTGVTFVRSPVQQARLQPRFVAVGRRLVDTTPPAPQRPAPRPAPCATGSTGEARRPPSAPHQLHPDLAQPPDQGPRRRQTGRAADARRLPARGPTHGRARVPRGHMMVIQQLHATATHRDD
jgi:hypothetical protein